MRKILLAVVGLWLTACASVQQPGPLASADAMLRGPGARSLVVAVEGSAGSSQILRAELAGGAREVASLRWETLLRLPGRVDGLAMAPGGRWLAVTRSGDGKEGVRTELWSLTSAASGSSEALWTSPAGCRNPGFGPTGGQLILACPAHATQPQALLSLRLDGLVALYLVGERGRTAPAYGVEGDLYWVEEYRSEYVVIRKPRDAMPFGTHRLDQPIERLWPQEDGSHWAELARTVPEADWVRLEPSGLVRDPDRPWPFEIGGAESVLEAPDAQGRVARVLCGGRDCFIQVVGPQPEAVLRWNVEGRPSAVALQTGPGEPVRRPEDLATAAADVLRRNAAEEVSVLGVALGSRLEEAFARLDRAGRNPYWMGSEPGRQSPYGVGVGWARGHHCIEYQTDDRGVIVAVDLRSCAAKYISPPLQPLLDGRSFRSQPESHAGNFLGPGLLRTMDGGSEAGRPAVRLRRVRFEAADRGYVFEAETRQHGSRPARFLQDRFLLRLRAPGSFRTSAQRTHRP